MTTTARFSLAALIVMSVASGAGAQERRKGEVEGGRLVGQVTDSVGRPLAGALVGLPQLELTATTNERGLYRLAGIPAGRYRMLVRTDSHVPEELLVTVRSGAETRQDVVLATHATQLPVVVVRAPEGGVSGVVHGADRSPLPNARVEVYGSRFRSTTGGDGRFRFSAIEPGGYLLRVTAPGFESRQFSVVVPAGEGVVLSVQMRAATRSPSNMVGIDFQNASQRRRWASRATSLFLVSEQLLAGEPQRVADLGQIYAVARSREPCVIVDGRRSPMPLDAFYPDEIEAIEVYPPDPSVEFGLARGRGYGPSLGGSDAPATYCRGTVFVWLKQN